MVKRDELLTKAREPVIGRMSAGTKEDLFGENQFVFGLFSKLVERARA